MLWNGVGKSRFGKSNWAQCWWDALSIYSCLQHFQSGWCWCLYFLSRVFENSLCPVRGRLCAQPRLEARAGVDWAVKLGALIQTPSSNSQQWRVIKAFMSSLTNHGSAKPIGASAGWSQHMSKELCKTTMVRPPETQVRGATRTE